MTTFVCADFANVNKVCLHTSNIFSRHWLLPITPYLTNCYIPTPREDKSILSSSCRSRHKTLSYYDFYYFHMFHMYVLQNGVLLLPRGFDVTGTMKCALLPSHKSAYRSRQHCRLRLVPINYILACVM